MWTRNYDNILCSRFGSGRAGDMSNFGDGYFSVKKLDGGIARLSVNSLTSTVTSYNMNYGIALTNSDNTLIKKSTELSSGNYTYFTINVGTGTTAPTYDDYILENPITSTSSLEVVSTTLSDLGFDSTTKTWGKRISRCFRNLTSSTMTISEVGIYGSCNTNGSAAMWVLLYREVLAEPITVEPDQKFEVSVDSYCQMIHHPDLQG